MATIRQRGNTYQFIVSLGRGMDGKQVRRTMTFTPTETAPSKIKKEVQRAADAFEADVRAFRIRSGKITFEQFTEKHWRPEWAKKELTLSQQEKYYFYIQRYGYPVLQTMRIDQIPTPCIQSIMTGLSDRLAPQTVKHIYTAINSVFKHAVSQGYINHRDNPCPGVKLPKIEQDTELHYFTKDQARTFLDFILRPYESRYTGHSRVDDTGKAYTVPDYTETHITQYQFRVLFDLAIQGGFRRGELIGLQWRDIDFEAKTITISRAVAKVHGGQIIKEPKTKKSARTVVMPTESMKYLQEWKRRQQELCMKLGTQWQGKRGTDFDENHVFIQIDSGLPMYVDTPSNKFRDILTRYNNMIDAEIKKGTATEADKLPTIHLHDLRHTSATLLVASGVDIETVAHRLGHSQVSMTLNRYAHAIPENDVAAAQVLERIFAV